MTFAEFGASLTGADPPAGLTTPLRALWLDGKGDWDNAHRAVDDPDTAAGARVHAYLHRKEGDLSNARHWYGQADVEPFTGPLEREWESLVRELLAAAAGG
jgi:hypothetical protein